jgi:protein-L-isoaspartate(D-aspartate) O-methyltransferase
MEYLNLELARHNMVEQQIRPWEVLDQRVLDALEHGAREDYVPAAYRNVAYADLFLPLGHGEVMLTPKLEARLLQALALGGKDKVLEIGTGSGYFTALLAALAGQVVSVDLHADFTEAARARLAAHGVANVALESGDAAQGWERGAPYDAIVVTGSLPVLPAGLTRQLAPLGRLVAIVGRSPAMEVVRLRRLAGDHIAQESLFETDVPALANAAAPPRFVF